MGEVFARLGVFALGIFIGINSSSVRITTDDWHKAKEMCSTNEGIDKFVARTLDENNVVCKNTAKFILKDEKK